MIIGRSKYQQEIDAQIDRLADEFRKEERSDGIHELSRDGDRNSEGLRGIWSDDEYLCRHPIPKVGEMRRIKKNGPKRWGMQKLWKLN